MSEGVFRQPWWQPPRQSWIPSNTPAGGNVTVTPTTATLTLATFAPTIKHQIIVPARALTLTTFAPVIKLAVTPSTASLTTTRFAPVIKHQITVPVRALTLATFAPSVNVGVRVTPTTASLTISVFAPVLKLSVIPPVKALTITAFAPVLKLAVTPTTAALVTTKFAPVLKSSIIVPVRALTLTTFAPTVTATTGGPQLVTPTTASLVLAAFAPTVTASGAAPSGGGGGAPFIRRKAEPKRPRKPVRIDVRVTPETARLILTCYAPAIAVSDNKTVTAKPASFGVFATRPLVVVKMSREYARSVARASSVRPPIDASEVLRGQRREAIALLEPMSMADQDAMDLAELEEIGAL